MQLDEDDQSLDIYDVEYGEFTGNEMHLSPRYSDEYNDYDAGITQLCSIGEDRYLMVIGNLYRAFPDDDLLRPVLSRHQSLYQLPKWNHRVSVSSVSLR